MSFGNRLGSLEAGIRNVRRELEGAAPILGIPNTGGGIEVENGGIYQIYNAEPYPNGRHKLLDIQGGGQNDGQPVIPWDLNGGNNQKWIFEKSAQHIGRHQFVYTIRSCHTFAWLGINPATGGLVNSGSPTYFVVQHVRHHNGKNLYEIKVHDHRGGGEGILTLHQAGDRLVLEPRSDRRPHQLWFLEPFYPEAVKQARARRPAY